MTSEEKLDASIAVLREEVHKLKVKNKRTILNNVNSREQIKKHLDDLTCKVESNLSPGSKSLAPYLHTIRSVMGVAPMYVQSLQAKFCQALHFMAIGNAQFSLFDRYCQIQVSELKSESHAMSEESTNISLALMNQMSKRDDSNHTMRMAYLRVLRAQCAILRALDMQVVNLTKEEDKSVPCDADIPKTPTTPRMSTQDSLEVCNAENNIKEENVKHSFKISSPTSVLRTTMFNDQIW
eukprot:CAMPEP_0178926578 /NCGR_PEP_ID=MMETSP0786-20121207/18625_1 /TAXON_ID=186022 /ORGANISM="Thalassionema frauenfeldii, Strain CCMP 1798" /LENGTH=237 /DNA_ID=CAMNT_0020601745 /DNA_START=113 /DNA_END=823 /DNA_ORIENTATION=-